MTWRFWIRKQDVEPGAAQAAMRKTEMASAAMDQQIEEAASIRERLRDLNRSNNFAEKIEAALFPERRNDE